MIVIQKFYVTDTDLWIDSNFTTITDSSSKNNSFIIDSHCSDAYGYWYSVVLQQFLGKFE